MTASDLDGEFLHALNRHLDAIAQRKIDDFAATVADDVRLIGTIEGSSAAIEAHRQWFADAAWRFEVAERVALRSFRDVGWALVRVHYNAGADSSRFFLLLLFSRHTDGVWRLIYDQATPIAPA
jgi:ketosteroid isomerase-like protein